MKQLVPLILLLPLLWVSSPAFAQGTVELRDITVTPGSGSASITFLLSGKVGTVVLEKKKNGRAQVRMKSVRAGKAALGSARVREGVRSVKAHIERKDVLVTNATFTREVTGMRVSRRDGESVVVEVTLGKTSAPSKEGSGDNSGSRQARGGSREARNRNRWSLSTIVIDPGHGGKDPGAIGLHDVQEKDVTLSVSLKLRDEIRRRMPGVTVVMTRSDDRFIELYRRGQIANEREGRLFISVHCNSMPEKPHAASGFECYILRPGKSEDAARVLAAENSAVRFESDKAKYEEMSAESAIVASMAQSAFIRYSEEVAGAIRRAMRGKIGIPDRGVHQAGFYVLVGASMPSVLIELGYLSNEKDVKVLKSTSGQKKIAKAIFEGIRAYEKVYSASLRGE